MSAHSDARSEPAATAGRPRLGERAEGRGLAAGELLFNGLHLTALTAFALAQPLFDVLQQEPEFFAARGSRSVDIIVFALLVTFGPPVGLVAVEAVVGLASRTVARALHLVFVAGLAAVVAMQALKDAGSLSTEVILVLAALIGALAAALYARAGGVRSFATVLSAAAVFFLVNFLFISPVSKLTFASEAKSHVGGVKGDAPVVVLGFDEFPMTSLLDERGRIDSERFPNFARFARDSTWFPNATGVHDRTTKAYPAILDGKMPTKRSLPIASDHPDNLFSLFANSGYRLNVAEQATRLCSEDFCKRVGREQNFKGRMVSLADDLSIVYGHLALPDGLARRLPSVSQTLGDFRGEGTVAGGATGPTNPASSENLRKFDQSIVQAVRSSGRPAQFQGWLQGITAGERPSLNFAHVFFPHVPWQYLPSGRRYMRGPDEPLPGLAERTLHDDFVVEQAYQRHLLQLEFTDRLLGDLMRRLREQGIYDKALIVLLADHGAAFRKDQDRRVVTEKNVEDLASIPLFFKAPGQRKGRVNDAWVRTIDIMPTIADLLDSRLPWKADGRSAFSRAVQRRRTVEMSQGEQATIGEGTGFKAVVPVAEFDRRQDALLQRKLELFGAGADRPGLFGIGPNPQLVGRRLSELPTTPAGAVGAKVNAAGELRRVRLRSDFLPALVSGSITGPGTPAPSRQLAFALNGRIVAVARSFELGDDSKEYFSAMLPEAAFRDGRNRLQVFQVSGGGASLQLLGEV